MSELGQILKKTREEKNISLDEIQENTKIQRRYLEAIERGDFHMLPGHFYVRAFIKSYAEAVGLDADQLFEQYEEELPDFQKREEQVQVVPKRNRRTRPPIRAGRWLSHVLLYSFILLILFVIYVAVSNSQLFTSDPDNTSVEDEQNVPGLPDVDGEPDENTGGSENSTGDDDKVNDPPEPQAEPEPSLTFVKKEGNDFYYDLTHSERIDVTISASRGNCWLEVYQGEGRENLYHSTLKNGESESWTVEESVLFIVTGNGPAVDIQVNGQPIDTSQLKNGRQTIRIELKN